MEIRLKIRRFNPDKDNKPCWGEYTVPAEPIDRLLDALNYVKWYIDGTLTYRRSCAHGVCGSDAMQINGHNALACKLLVRNLGKQIAVAPLPAFPVLKDLVVDIKGFFEINKNVKAYFITHTQPPEKERLQSPEQREKFDDTTKAKKSKNTNQNKEANNNMLISILRSQESPTWSRLLRLTEPHLLLNQIIAAMK